MNESMTIFDTIDVYTSKGLKLLLERLNNGWEPTDEEYELIHEALQEEVCIVKADEAHAINGEDIEDIIYWLLGGD